MKFWKLAIIEITVLIAVGILGSTSGIHAAPVNHRPTEAGLLNDFRDYNDRYFYGALRNVTIKLTDLSAYDQMGLTESRSNGTFVISIDIATNPVWKEADLTLLHEMCHVKLKDSINLVPGETNKDWDSHGSGFQSCMIHLAEHGAFNGLW